MINNKRLPERLLFISLLFVGTFVIYALISNYFRLHILINKYATEFIFLLITGIFLCSFHYDITGVRITYNSFIIYFGNNILKIHNFKGIELIYLFIVIYFTTQMLSLIITSGRRNTYKVIIHYFYNMLKNTIMWIILISVYNGILNLFDVNITTLRLIDILFSSVAIIVHHVIKTLLMIISNKVSNKYYSFLYHTTPYIIIDSVFIYFSIILGSIYHTIGILNSAFFIIFIAIIISFARFIIKMETEYNLIFSIYSFLQLGDTQDKVWFNNYPIVSSENGLNHINPDIQKMFFILIEIGENIDDIKKQNAELFIERRFFLIKNKYLYTVIPDFLFSQDKIKKMIAPGIRGKLRLSYCCINKSNFPKINVNYILRILLYKFKIMKNVTEIVTDESYIFS